MVDANKTYTVAEIHAVLDRMMKKEMQHKDRYIELNGYKHKNTLDMFANRISMLSELYGQFK